MPRLRNVELDFATANCGELPHAGARFPDHETRGVRRHPDKSSDDGRLASAATPVAKRSLGFTHPLFPVASTDVHALGQPAVSGSTA